MALDVTERRVIAQPPERVAAYAMDWRHDHEWTQGIKQAALTRDAYFLGKRIDYVLEVVRRNLGKDLRDLERRL